MKKFTILPMNEAHAAQVAELEKLCFPDPWSLAAVESELHNPLSLWLVAVSDDKVIGYVGSQTVCGESDIMNLAVHPMSRKKGIASALMTALSDELRRGGVTALMLEVRHTNEPAILLYEKLGFTCVGIRPNYYLHPREDARIMRKELI